MMTVLTTLIESIGIDRTALAQRFVAARISYRGWSKDQRDEELPGLVTRIYRAGPVLALIQHRKESEYWVLLPCGVSLQLKDDTLACRTENLDSTPQWVLMALLVRALPRVLEQSAGDAGQRFEADGLYYVVARKSVGTNHIITTVQVSLEWSIGARQHRLAISTVTFTPLKLHERPDGQLPRTIARAPRYQPDMLGQNVVRTGRGDYVKRALWRRTKTRVPAFKLSGRVTLESYYKTRLGVLSLFLEDLRRAYGGMFQIQLKRISPTYGKRVTRKEVERTYNKLSELLQQQPVRIINQSDAADVGIDLQAQLSRRGIDAAIASTIDPGELNLLVVNDPESYEDGDIDPYKEARIQHPQAVIQSCLPDRLKDGSRHVVEVLLKELFLKYEIQQRTLLLDYPVLPPEAWFITSVRPEGEDAAREPWPMFYGIVRDRRLELCALPEQMKVAIKESLTEQQIKAVFEGFSRADLVFWPETDEALTLVDTEALCLPDEVVIHQIVRELDRTVNQGVPEGLLSEYCNQNPVGKLRNALKALQAAHGVRIPVEAFRKLPYRGSESKSFYDFLAAQGFRVKASLQAKGTGPLSITSGIWIDKERAMYAAGGADSAQRDQETFNHVYKVLTNGLDVPDWFWHSLEVWHIRHRGTTVSPYIFKHVREFGLRQCQNVICG